MLVRDMYTKRIILLIVGVVVAIAICFSTSLFGMKTAHVPPESVQLLEPYPHFISVIYRDVDRNTMVRKF
jgi:hypothetical protein